MPSRRHVRTYGRTKQITKKTISNYVPKPVTPVKVTEASTAIDALFTKNIRKRYSSPDNRNVIKKKTRGRPKKTKISELPKLVHPTMLKNDSLNVNINSTFDNLLQGPVYNQVKICNKSSLYVNNSTDTSNSKIISDKVQSPYNTRKKRKKNYAALHSDGSHIVWESNVLQNGKIRKRRTNPKKLKHIIKNTIINISDISNDQQNISKKLHSYLDKSINYSLIIDKQSKSKLTSTEGSFKCARKYTPIAATYRLPSLNNKLETTIFRQGFRHLMRADNTPRYIHSSTPIVSKNIQMDDKLNVSPITASAKTRLNFTTNHSKSLFDSKKLTDVSSIQNNVNNSVHKNSVSNVILINSTFPEIVESNNFDKDGSVDNYNSLIKVRENKEQSLNVVEDKIISEENNINLNKSSLIANDVKLNAKAVVVLENHLDILGINENTSVLCKFINPKRTFMKTELVPVVLLDRLSLSKYLKNYGLVEYIPSRSASKDPQISSTSLDYIETLDVKNNTSRIRVEQFNSTNFSNAYEEMISNQNSSERRLNQEISTRSHSNNNKKIVSKSSHDSEDLGNSNINEDSNIINNKPKKSTRLRYSSGNLNDNEQNTNLRISVNSTDLSNIVKIPKHSTRLRYSLENLSNKRKSNQSDIENSSRSMFDSYNSDIIENSIHDLPIAKHFITTRKKKIQMNIETFSKELKESTKHLNISSKTLDIFTQSKVSLVRLEDSAELNKNSNIFKIKDNRVTGRKTYANVVHFDKNRKSIILKPGKKWFRSLSILRRTNFYEIEEDKHFNKGRKWRDSIIEVLDKQNDGAFNKISDETAVNDMKQTIKPSTRAILGIRKSLKIVNISVKDLSNLAEKTVYENKSGYVSSLAHVSVLESFDKLSLSTNVDEREETARQIILKRCGQTDPIPFDDCYSSRTLKKCRKIGEGVYGEVFMYKSSDNKCRVMKVIPIEGNLAVNGEHQKKFEEIISEIIIASELSNLRINNEFCTNGFAELLQIFCVQGKYPQHLLDLWDLFDEERGSENDSPEIFTEDQLYIVLELENGGQDLEAYRFNNAEQSYALFVQVVCSMAVAESALQFEHRDMHWGNILISPTDEATTTFRLKGREFEVATRGVQVSIIDFTLSRMTYNNCCIYNDLALDPDLFTATGDYQFDIYRLMKQRNLNDWQTFEPYSNILWLDYTLEKMISQVRYLRETTKTHKTCIRRLSQIRKKILNYNSATELLNSDVFSHVFL